MLETQLMHLQSDISILRHYADLRSGGGANEMPTILEYLIRHVFNVIVQGDFRNLNQIKVNYAAVDLADANKRIVVQVTVNANKTKIYKTIAAFKKAGLASNYDQLYIFGLRAQKKAPVESWCQIWDFDDVIEKLREFNDVTKVGLISTALASHVDYNRLHPYSDLGCLKIMIGVINRDAIIHSMGCEGPYDRMMVGLDEITEVITKGTVGGLRRCKDVGRFDDGDIQNYLLLVKGCISKIKAIVNKFKNPSGAYYYLPPPDSNRVDELKEEVARLTNDIASRYQLAISMHILK